MPRARINEAEDEAVVPKPRARKPRAVSVDGDIPPVRKRAAPRAKVVTADPEPVTRKAPTPFASRKQTQSRNTKALLGVLFVCLCLVGAGVGIGMTDRGTIDVVAVVNERNEKISKGEVRDASGNTVTQTIQVQTDVRPNGGLPMGDAPATPPPPPEASTTTASTTPESASSTESVETATDATTTATTL